jgi:hypothetical protein
MSVQMQKKALNIYLSVEQSGDDIIAHLLFQNNGVDDIYLDTWAISVGNIFVNDLFSIFDENNNSVSYSGMLARRDVVPEDFVILNPQEEIKTKIYLNKGYKLTKGKKYTIRYCANNPSYLGKQHLMDLLSNKVEIFYV